MNEYIKRLEGKSNVFLSAKYGMGIVYNYILYGASISDYFELRYYAKKSKEKRQYITSKEAFEFAKYVDGEEAIIRLNSKTEMYKRLRSYVKRDQLFLPECCYDDFLDFTKRHGMFIYKPDTAECGRGIEKITVTRETDTKVLFNELKAKPAVLDECISQHHLLEEFHPDSINTVRIYTLMIDDMCYLIAGFFRTGLGKSIVDNLGSGGVLAGIDLEKGILLDDAIDEVGHKYTVHPDSGIPFKGFQIPNWEEILMFVKEAASHYELKYVGWDIAVRENDCVIVEANPDPMIHGIQSLAFGEYGRKNQYEALRQKLEYYRNPNDPI